MIRLDPSLLYTDTSTAVPALWNARTLTLSPVGRCDCGARAYGDLIRRPTVMLPAGLLWTEAYCTGRSGHRAAVKAALPGAPAATPAPSR